jgi:nucleoid DNA-binding protein
MAFGALAQVGPRPWMAPETMNKAELIDAIASKSGLSKADAKRALDGFADTTASVLREGRRIALEGFGSFSVSARPASSDGCDTGVDVDFTGGPGFRSGNNPLYEDLTPMQDNPLFVESISGPGGNRPLAVYGKSAGDFARGEEVFYLKELPADGIIHRDVATRLRVLGVIVDGDTSEGGRPLPDRYASSAVQNPYFKENSLDGEMAGIMVSGGPSNPQIHPDGVVVKAGEVIPGESCGEADGVVTDDQFVKLLSSNSKLTGRAAADALDSLVETVVEVVDAGGIVDLEGFGQFAAETTITATINDPCAGTPENCPPEVPILAVDIWELSVSLTGASQGEIDRVAKQVESISKRAARTGRNPQTGKEIKIAAKNKVKFKAGAELSKKVN